MLLQKILAWSVMYPILVVSYMGHVIFQVTSFFFNSPVDMWNIIGKELEEQQAEGE